MLKSIRFGETNETVDQKVGRRIALARAETGITAAQLAFVLDLTEAQLAGIEAGAVRASAELLFRLSRDLWRPVHFFFDF